MRLSELKTGESATIVKVMGHGGFRRRIMEMGFVRGQRVEVILNAPLKDPIEYKIMGYDISLRRSEADMVVVLTDDEAGEYLARRERHRHHRHAHSGECGCPAAETAPAEIRTEEFGATESDEACCASIDEVVARHSRTIAVALVGNPNSGKTSLFNAISGGHEHVGNYSGVTGPRSATAPTAATVSRSPTCPEPTPSRPTRPRSVTCVTTSPRRPPTW